MKNIYEWCVSKRTTSAKVAHTKMMGAQKARTMVKNHCRTPTISRFFFVRIQVCLRIAMAVGASARGEGVGRVVLLSCRVLDRCQTRANQRGRRQSCQATTTTVSGSIPVRKSWRARAKGQRRQFAIIISLTRAHGVYALPSRQDSLVVVPPRQKRGRRVGKSEAPPTAARRPMSLPHSHLPR